MSGATGRVRMHIRDSQPASGGVRIDGVAAGRAPGFPGIQIFEQSRNEELLSARSPKLAREVRWSTGWST